MTKEDVEQCCELSKRAVGLYRKENMLEIISANEISKYKKPFVLEEIKDNEKSEIKAFTVGLLIEKYSIADCEETYMHLLSYICNVYQKDIKDPENPLIFVSVTDFPKVNFFFLT